MLCNASVRSADLSLIIAIDDTRRELSIEPALPAAGDSRDDWSWPKGECRSRVRKGKCGH
jgi:hypothetical protein